MPLEEQLSQRRPLPQQPLNTQTFQQQPEQAPFRIESMILNPPSKDKALPGAQAVPENVMVDFDENLINTLGKMDRSLLETFLFMTVVPDLRDSDDFIDSVDALSDEGIRRTLYERLRLVGLSKKL